jgi:glycosyltransferase involved in cell wall biosynthesis
VGFTIMSAKAPRILFVSHSAGRNGATILLLHLLRWLKECTDFRLEILVNGSGEMVPEFQAIGPTIIWRDPASLIEPHHRNTLTTRVGSAFLKSRLMGRSYDLIYLNTSAVAPQVRLLAEHARTILWHIHELEYVLRLTAPEEKLCELFPLVTRVVAVSNSVRSTLVSEFNVQSDKLDVIPGFVPLPSSAAQEHQAHRRSIRRKLGWPEDAFVVGGCGALGWRKGTDVFLRIAQTMINSDVDDRIRFLWVGGPATGDDALQFNYDVRLLRLQERCQRIPATPEAMQHYHAMDAFALTSREDPFPLVMLEAAACGLPVVCFSDSGGGPEFVMDSAGLIAPYLDTVAFTRHLETLHRSPDVRRRMGDAGAEKVRREHVIESQGPKLLASIERCLSRSLSWPGRTHLFGHGEGDQPSILHTKADL